MPKKKLVQTDEYPAEARVVSDTQTTRVTRSEPVGAAQTADAEPASPPRRAAPKAKATKKPKA